jgi:hypothetical protein
MVRKLAKFSPLQDLTSCLIVTLQDLTASNIFKISFFCTSLHFTSLVSSLHFSGAPAYIGEMSPPSIRGLLVSLKEATIVLGILLGFLIGEYS